jgi:T5SS/PEP-CTERM-associated repeat protein
MIVKPYSALSAAIPKENNHQAMPLLAKALLAPLLLSLSLTPSAQASPLQLSLLSPLFIDEDKDWVGGIGDWDTAANWNPNGVPDEQDFITVTGIGSEANKTGQLFIGGSGDNGTLAINGEAIVDVTVKAK